MFPVFLFLIFAFIYKNELVSDLPIAIYDADGSRLSQTVVRFAESSSSMKIEKHCVSLNELKEEFLNGTIQGAFYIPDNFEKDVKSGKPSSIIVYKNSSNVIISNLILKEGTTIVKTVSAGALMKKLRATGMMEEQAMHYIQPIKIETQSLFNPNYSYLSYLFPGLALFTLQMLIMISAVVVISSEFTHDTFPELLKIADNKLGIILLGKALPHFLINASTVMLIAGILFPMFNIKVYGSITFVILFMLYFVAACLAVGLFISSLFHNQLLATEIAVFLNTPAFIFSGFTFPLWGMPFATIVYAQFLPLTHFMSGLIKIYQMDAPIIDVLPEIGYLSIFLFGSILLTIPALKYHVKKYYPGN
jgi:ABC-2 type transport system permease protein